MQWLESAILLLVVVIAYVYWKPWLRPAVKEMLAGDATVYFFYTEWCGHSKKAMPEWKALMETLPATYGSTKVVGKAVNCEEDVMTCTAYGVDAYPTVKLETSGGIADFTKLVTESSVDRFLTGELGEKA
jgi:thioredoxin-like negative regulator of GroEL